MRATRDTVRFRAYARGSRERGFSVKLTCWSCNATIRTRVQAATARDAADTAHAAHKCG